MWDPDLLDFRAPEKTYSLTDLGMNPANEICDFGTTEAFPLASEKGVKAFREELFSDEVNQTCRFSSSRTPSMIRGPARHCPRLRDFWSSQQVTDIVSSAAGIPLRPIMEYEIASTNIQVDTEPDDSKMVDDWHTDSYPFVAIMLLSDPSKSSAGETAVRKMDGSIIPLAYPTAGSCIVMQGRAIWHCGRRALPGSAERITLVTSYVPKDACIPDPSGLMGTYRVSNCAQLYFEWTQYRLGRAADQVASRLAALKAVTSRELPPEEVQTVKAWLKDLEDLLRITREEMK